MDVLVLVVLVDPGTRFEERLHEQVQEGRHPDLRTHEALERAEEERWQVSPGTPMVAGLRAVGLRLHHTQQLLQCIGSVRDGVRKSTETLQQEFVLTKRELRETQTSHNPPSNQHWGVPLYCENEKPPTSSTGGGSMLVNILNRTVMSAGFRAPLDNIAPRAWQALG